MTIPTRSLGPRNLQVGAIGFGAMSPGRPVPRRAPRAGRDGRAAPESFFLQGPVAPWTGPDDEEAELIH